VIWDAWERLRKTADLTEVVDYVIRHNWDTIRGKAESYIRRGVREDGRRVLNRRTPDNAYGIVLPTALVISDGREVNALVPSDDMMRGHFIARFAMHNKLSMANQYRGKEAMEIFAWLDKLNAVVQRDLKWGEAIRLAQINNFPFWNPAVTAENAMASARLILKKQ